MQDPHRRPDTPLAEALAWLILAFRPPEADSVRQLASVDPDELLARMGSTLQLEDRTESACDTEARLHTLQSEYVRLFVNARHTPVAHLDAASYLTDDGPAAQTALLEELTETLRDAGLAMAPQTRLPLDHLATLLEVLLWSDMINEPELYARVQHLLCRWVPQMLQRLEQAKPDVWYVNAARILAVALNLDVPFGPGPVINDSESPDGFPSRQDTRG
jgi:TorA maturation chaperone TorD